jgi:hypothetical protein
MPTFAEKLMWLQANTVSFSLEVNDHRTVYESIDTALESEEADADLKTACSKSGQLVIVHCYPDTPVGFYRLIDTEIESAVSRMFNIVKHERDERASRLARHRLQHERHGRMSDKTTFEGWVILELMGHRRLAGHLSEVSIAGGSFVRIDVPKDVSTSVTQFYSPSAVYCITPTTEDTARAVARGAQPAPVQRWELPPEPKSEPADEVSETGDDAEELAF